MIVNVFSKAVNKAIALEALLEDEYAHLHVFFDDLAVIREHYHKFKLEHGLMDYDDLLVNLKKVLAEVPEVREILSNRFSHIMVDEYQDTNPIQAEIVRLMANSRNNVMVVGDDSQSIYSFRGADFRNIMDFPQIFPETRIIRLEENYRSTSEIIAHASRLISFNKTRHDKVLRAARPGGTLVESRAQSGGGA